MTIKRTKFQAYGAGIPTVKFEFSFDDKTIYLAKDGIEESMPITTEQFARLSSAPYDKPVAAAAVWLQVQKRALAASKEAKK